MAMMKKTMDGNEAAAYAAYAFTEVAAIYPITPSSPMAELTDKNRSRRDAYLEWIELKRSQKRLLLEELAERAETLLKEDIPSKTSSMISEEMRVELKKLRDGIAGEFRSMSSRTDKIYLHIASQLKRNPTAVSKKFARALEELKNTLENTE